MSRKTLIVQMMLFISLVLIGGGASAERRADPQASANSSGTCTDAKIKAAVVKGIRNTFPLRKTRGVNPDKVRVIVLNGKKVSRFHFVISSSNKVVTLSGWVPGEELRQDIIAQVEKIIAGLNCGITLNPDVRDSEKGVFRNNSAKSCPDGQVECPNGECKATLAACEKNLFDN